MAGVSYEKACPARGHQSIPAPHVIMQQGRQESSVCTTQNRETWRRLENTAACLGELNSKTRKSRRLGLSVRAHYSVELLGDKPTE